MLRAVLGALAGMAVAVAVVAGVEWLGHRFYPIVGAGDLTNPVVMRSMPLPAKLFVVGAWLSGAFVGAAAALLVSGRNRWAGWAPPVLVLVGTAAALFTIPHPIWMATTGIAAPLVAGWSAARIWGAAPA
jgi:hypothetical protein